MNAIAWFDVDRQRVYMERPRAVAVGPQTFFNPNDEIISAAGLVAVEYDADIPAGNRVIEWNPPRIRSKTETEIAIEQAALDELATAREAAASLPATFANGVAVQDAAGHWVELVPDGSDVVAVQVSNSPLSKAQHDEMKSAALAARESKKAAKAALKAAVAGAKNDKDTLAAVVKWIEAQ